jgi:acetyl esterase/lipase
MKNYKHAFILVFILLSISVAHAQRLPAIYLWPKGAPGAKAKGGDEIVNIYEQTGDHLISNIHNPSITPYIPSVDKATGIAVIIAPGGAHRELWIDHEGYTIAQQLAENGIAAFVLKYRLAREKNSTYTVEEHSVKDMLRAIRLVRSKA